jgi:3-hydroxybutyryl-CoA dehydrogenase
VKKCLGLWPPKVFTLLTLAIIGAGPLGRWLAARAAEAGHTVFLEDVMPLNLRHAQEELRQRLGPTTLPLVSFVNTIEDALRTADLAIDCVPDELESKLEIFCLMDRMSPPRTVFATPSTKLSIADLASCTYRPGQCVAILRTAASFTSAEHAESTLLRISTTSKTSEATINLLNEFWTNLGFTPAIELDSAEATLI